jgi:hypothetical protein
MPARRIDPGCVPKMTEIEFVDYMTKTPQAKSILVEPPHDIRPCTCRDINCRGWKIVRRES